MALSEEVIARRLRAVDQSSESIQTTSMWILHHRDSSAQFVSCWTEVFKTASDALQIALFYVANDVCQKAKKKGDSHVLLQAFAPHWVNAISYSRGSENVQKAVSRILDIFEERQIYSKSQLADMRAAQNDGNELEDNTLLDFDIGYLIRDVEGYHKGNLVMERARELLSRSDFNFKDKIKSRMKDRRDGEKFMGEIEQSYTKLTDFFGALAKHRKRGQHLLNEVERAKRCFTLQLRDVTVVEDAYQKFGTGIEEVCGEVEEMLKTSVYPGASPPRDAPSPTANDDPFSEGVEIAFKQMRGPQCSSSSLLPLPKVVPAKEESIVTADSLQTNQSFRGSVHMLKMMEGIRTSETSRTNSPSTVVSDPRLAPHPPFPSIVGSVASGEPATTTVSSSFPLLSQASSSGSLSSSGPSTQSQSQVSQTPPFQLISSSVAGAPSVHDVQISLSNDNPPQWMHGSSPNFSTSLPNAVVGTMVDVASISGTTNSLQTPIISSQLHGSQTANTTTVPPVLGSRPSAPNTNPQIGPPPQSTTVPGILPPPPPNVRPSLGVPPLTNFVPAAMPSYTAVSAASGPSPATIPFPPGSFTIPPPRPLAMPPPTSLNIPPPGVIDCVPPGTFPLSTSSFSPVTPLDSCIFSSLSPSSSNSPTVASVTTINSRRPHANGGDNDILDAVKINGDLHHESRKHFENYGTTLDNRGDRRTFGGFHGGGDIGSLRDPRGRDRDRERNGNRGSQQQLHSNGGRRYSSDNRNRMIRYRNYDDDHRSRRYELPRDDFSRNRR